MDGSPTARTLVARFGQIQQCRDLRSPDTTRASSNRRRRTIIGLSAASITVRPRRQPTTPTFRHTSGIRHFHRQTDFGRTAPNLSTTDGPQSDAVTAATAAIAAASGKSGVRSPTRRTSPVMTNKRIESVLEPARNAAVMAPPSPDPYPADYSAALPQSLPLHPDPLFDLVPNAKTREAQGLAGFGPGTFLPLTLSLCHKQKNKSRTFSNA